MHPEPTPQRQQHEFHKGFGMSPTKLRVGIIGCGKIADAHVGEVRATTKAEVVAVCDREKLMAKQLSDRFAIQGVYDDVAAMLRDERLDVVHIATPPDSHPALASMAFAAGCHVFLEKPFALTAHDTQRVYDQAAQTGRQVAVNYLYNHESPYLELKQRLDSGSIGEVVHIDASYGYDLAGDYGLARSERPRPLGAPPAGQAVSQRAGPCRMQSGAALWPGRDRRQLRCVPAPWQQSATRLSTRCPTNCVLCCAAGI